MSATTQVFDPTIFRDDLKIEETNLNQAFVSQASLYAYYAELYAGALKAEGRAKVMVEITESKTDKAIRDEAVGTGVKLTETMLDRAIARAPEVVKARLAHNDAKAYASLLHGAVKAFEQRRDMLIQMGATDRQAMKGELRSMAHAN